MTSPVPVQSVRLTSKDLSRTHAIVYTDGQPVVFNEDEHRHLYCDVIGSYPEPRVAMFIDHSDVTDQFTKTVQLVRDPASRNFFYHVTLTKDAFRVGYVQSTLLSLPLFLDMCVYIYITI